MKKLVTLVAVALLLAAVAASAQETNVLGVFFDQAGTNNCLASYTQYTTLNAYLVAKSITESSGISGWEATIRTDPATFPAGITYTMAGANAINVLTAPVFQVGLPTALPYSPAMTLLTMSTFYLGGTIMFGVGPCQPTSFPANPGPGFAAGADPGRLVSLVPSSNVLVTGVGVPPYTYWVAGVGAGPSCPVANVPSSWSNVKSLYQ